MRRALWLVLVAIGCGSGGSGSPAFTEDGQLAHSGSRLKLRWYVWDDGTAQWEPNQIFDTARGEWCYPRPWDDGVSYCTPGAADGVFADASCTVPLVVADPGLGYLPAYVAWGDHITDSYNAPHRVAVTSVHAVGDMIAKPATVYQLYDGVCTAETYSGYTAYAPGAQVVRSDLVAMGETAPDPAQRLSLIHRTSPDGLDMPYALHDSMLDVDCVPASRPDVDAAQCEPLGVFPATEFSDPVCAQPLISAWGVSPAPLGVLGGGVQGCRTLFTTGAAVMPATAYTEQQICRSYQPVPGVNLFAPDQALALATTTRVLDTAGTRLQRILFDGLPDARLHDTATGVDCEHPRDDASVFSCAPADTPGGDYVDTKYADSSCTTPINWGYVSKQNCGGAPSVVTVLGARYQVLGPPPVLFQRNPVGPPCIVFMPPDMEGYEIHQMGPAMALAAPMSGRLVDPQ